MWGYLTPPGSVLTLWGVEYVSWLCVTGSGIVALVWALAAIAAFLVLTESAYPRYGLQAIPPLWILIAIGFVDLWTAPGGRSRASMGRARRGTGVGADAPARRAGPRVAHDRPIRRT